MYSRATRCWEDAPVFPSGEAPPPVPALPFAGDRRFTESSPQLSSPDVSPLTPELQEPLPPLLEPRTYQPVNPTPSLSLAPYTPRKRSSNVTTISMLLPRDEEERVWSSTRPETIQLSPSPPPMSPVFNHKYSLSASDKPSDKIFVPEHGRSGSQDSQPSATLSGPFDCPSTETHWRSDSIDKAFSHMRLGSDVTRTLPQAFAKLPAEPEDQSETSEDILSSDYRDKLIDEYRDLAPPKGPWQDDAASSDAEATAHELKMVPAPLFWENRHKELYPQRTIYAQQKNSSKAHRILMGDPTREPAKKHKKKVSLNKAPLQMILPSHHKRKSAEDQEDSPTTAALKQALALRLKSKKQKDDVEVAEDSPRLFHGKVISKPMQDGPMPLQLPKIAYRDVEVKKPALSPPSAAFLKPQHAWRSSGTSASTASSTDKKAKSSKSKKRIPDPEEDDPYGIGSELRAQYGTDYDKSQGRERRRSSHGLLHPPKISNIFHRTPSPSASQSSFEKGHKRNKSSGGGSSTDQNLASAFSPIEDERKSMRPAIFDKALDVMRDRERDKRRKDLKSQIKFVGKVDPNTIHQEPQKQRRETFGEGWI